MRLIVISSGVPIYRDVIEKSNFIDFSTSFVPIKHIGTHFGRNDKSALNNGRVAQIEIAFPMYRDSWQ